jgi:hypothetical protein
MTREAQQSRLRGITNFFCFRKQQTTTPEKPSFDERSSLSSTSPEGGILPLFGVYTAMTK